MNIGIKKCIKYLLLFLLLFAVVWLFTQCQSKEIKVDRQSYDEHADQYLENIRHFLESDECRDKYQKITYEEDELYDGGYCKELIVRFSENSTLYIYINHCYSIESFSLNWHIGLDEYGAGKAGIDWNIVMGMLSIVSGYQFSEEKLSYFVENALENNVVKYESFRDGYKIHDHDSINFMGDWIMCYSVQENNVVSGVPLLKYSTVFTVSGLTKTGMKS